MSFNPNLYQEKYRIPSARAKWWEYFEGIYFVTIITKNRHHYFGEITRNPITGNHEMHFSKLGAFVNESIAKISDHEWYAYIPVWTVMPNHVHLIIMVDVRGREINQIANISVETCESHVSTIMETNGTMNKRTTEFMRSISPKTGSLAIIINQFKRAVTIYAHKTDTPFAWQPRYYDVILKKQYEFYRIRQYIEINVQNWQTDKLYS